MDGQNVAGLKNRRLTLKQYLQLPPAMILAGDGHQAMVDGAFGSTRRKTADCRKNSVSVPAVFAIAQTDLVLTVPRTFARIAETKGGLRMIKPP